MQTIINPLVVSVGPTNETIITPVPMTHHGGGVKKVIAVVAAVAIPIAAPAIASAIAGSAFVSAGVAAAMTTTAGAVVSSAIVGAGLGAITAKVTGGSVKAGAISGLIGGGIGGYMSASKPGMFGNAASPTAGTNTTASTLSGGNVAGSGTTTTLPDGMTTASYSPDGQIINASMPGSTVSSGVNAQLSNQVANEGFVASMKAGLSNAGEMVVDRLTNPDTLANAVLQVGGAVAAEAIVGTPDTSPETQQAIEEYKQELQALKARDEDAFNAKMDAAKQYMVQAGYYDPQYFGLQSANRAAIAEGRKLREFERKAGLTTGGVSAGDRRRAALSGGANVQSAFDRGFISGVDLQNKAMSTGVGLIPNAPTGAATAQLGLANFYAKQDSAAQRAADAKKSNIQKFFGAFNTQSGQTKAQKEANKKDTAGLNTGNMPNLDQKKNNIPDPFVVDPDKKKDEPLTLGA